MIPPPLRAPTRVALLAVALALATWVFGWWSVPAIAVIWTLMSPHRPRTPLDVALASLLAWSALLALAALEGPVPEMAHRLGVTLHIGAAALIAVTVVFPAALAWTIASTTRLILFRLGAALPPDESVTVDPNARRP